MNQVPGPVTTSEDTSVIVSGISISDIDAGTASIQVQLSVLNGTLAIDSTTVGGVTAGQVTGDGTGTVTITASLTAINATLASSSGLRYVPNPDSYGTDGLTVSTNDLGNSGDGGPRTDQDTILISVSEVNDSPIGSGETLVSIAEDSGNYTIPFVTLLGNDSTGPGNESGQSLTITNVGSAVGGLVSIVGSNVIFSPTLNFNGAASFVYTIRDNGQTAGVDDFKITTATASFTITEVNDAPNAVTNVVPFYVGPGTRTITQASLLANDTPGPANESNQTLTFGTVGSPLPSGATVVVSGSDVLFTPPLGYSGPASFTYTVTDNGTTNGSPDPLTSTGTASLFFLFPGVALPAVDLNGPLANFGNTVTYTENNPPVGIPAATATVTDTDSTYLLSVTAKLLNSPDGASEVLSAVTAGTSITSSYNPTTRVLTLMGPDSAVNFQQVLRTVAYQNTSEAPTVTPARTVRFVANDGANASSFVDATVNVVAVNDAPTVSGTSTGMTYNENAGKVVVFPDLSANDPDSIYYFAGGYSAGLTKATITISPYIAGEDKLDYTNVGIMGTFNATTGVFTLSGNATLAKYNDALRLITYQNLSDNPNTTPRTISVTVFDSTTRSSSLSRTLTINSINDAPIVDLNGPVAAGGNYATTYRTSIGTVALAYSTSTASDADNTNLASLTVTIGNVQNVGSEVLTYTLPGGISASAPSGNRQYGCFHWQRVDGDLSDARAFVAVSQSGRQSDTRYTAYNYSNRERWYRYRHRDPDLNHDGNLGLAATGGQ